MKVEKTKRTFKQWFKDEVNETKVLFKGLPAVPFAVICLSFIVMNLLATVALYNVEWAAGDIGIIVSWLSFLFGDMFVKRYGAKGAIKIQVAALFIALTTLAIMALGAFLEKALWGANYTLGVFSWETNADNGMVTLWTIGASAAAFLISAVVDAIISNAILTKFKKRTSFKAHAVAAWGSTFVGQFVDNLVFAFLFTFIASRVPGLQMSWGLQPVTVLAVFTCAIIGGLTELVLQVIFSPIGFKVAEKWRKEGVGAEYIALVPQAQEVNTDLE